MEKVDGMDVISESDPNGSSSEDKASNTNSKGGTSNGNADASHSDSGDSHLSPPSKLKKCSKFSSQFNIAKMVKLIGRLTGPQKDIVTSCGFGSILSLKCTSIPNALVLWIAKHYDPRVDNSRVLAPHLLRLMQLLSIRSLVFHLEERKSQTNHLVVQSLSF